ncbi:MAG: SpoIIE family protein phosphatase [Candidatus Methylacidiphilales bacterium]|nr:SpoIIE family protein phosphatase [Candidatus Methylacidiphilales bacterium]
MDDSPLHALQARYRALITASRALFSVSTLDDIVEQILRHSRQMMAAEACSMFLPDHKQKELILYSARGVKDAVHSLRIPWDKGIAGACFHQKEAVRIDDVQNDPRFYRGPDSKSGFVTRAMLCMPLIDKTDCLGVIQAINPTQGAYFSDLDQELFEGLASIVTSALLRLEREKKAAEDAKMARELALAHEIQTSFLPPEVVLTPRAEIRVKYKPARVIGGDFYSALPMPGNRILMATGDVSGKGIPAALTTAQITGEISALGSVAQNSLSEFVKLLNKGLCGRLAFGRFVATSFLIYDGNAGTMEVLCAGQFPPWRWTPDGWEVMDVPPSLPMGISPDYPYEAVKFSCEPGEKWLLFSDGINEGRNPTTGEDYGFDRLKASLPSSSTEQILAKAWSAWSSYVDTTALHDDACMCILSPLPENELTVDSQPSASKKVRHFVEAWAIVGGFSDLIRGQMVLAVDEAFTNIIRHTYLNEMGKEILLTARLEGDQFMIQLRDFGPPVDKEKLKGRSLEDLKPGGLGLHLLNVTFETVNFEHAEPGTLLSLSRRLPDLHDNPLPEATLPATESELNAKADTYDTTEFGEEAPPAEPESATGT